MFRIYQIAIFLMVLSISFTTAASIKFSERLDEYSLENGLKVILIEDKRSPAVINSIWYRVGSSNEVRGKTGISHILEHMMFKGTNKLGPGEFSSRKSRKWEELTMLLQVKIILATSKKFIKRTWRDALS